MTEQSIANWDVGCAASNEQISLIYKIKLLINTPLSLSRGFFALCHGGCMLTPRSFGNKASVCSHR